jgi:hypothetical protein
MSRPHAWTASPTRRLSLLHSRLNTRHRFKRLFVLAKSVLGGLHLNIPAPAV